jgi:hypothetical protein
MNFQVGRRAIQPLRRTLVAGAAAVDKVAPFSVGAPQGAGQAHKLAFTARHSAAVQGNRTALRNQRWTIQDPAVAGAKVTPFSVGAPQGAAQAHRLAAVTRHNTAIQTGRTAARVQRWTIQDPAALPAKVTPWSVGLPSGAAQAHQVVVTARHRTSRFATRHIHRQGLFTADEAIVYGTITLRLPARSFALTLEPRDHTLRLADRTFTLTLPNRL